MGKNNKLFKDAVYVDCWSPAERKMKEVIEKQKGILFDLITRVLIKLNITANMVSYFSALVGVISVVFLWYDLKISGALLITSFILDGVDGALARATNQNNFGGSLTDCFADQIVISASTIGFMALKFIDPIIGGLYLVLYPIVIIFTIIRNILNMPRRYVFRPRLIVFGIFILYAYTSINIFNYVVLPLAIVLFIQAIWDFYFFRRIINS